MQHSPPADNKINSLNFSGFVLLFVAIKIGLNLMAMSRFGLQRDELLHVELSNHLAWGYIEVPPFIALMAKISTAFFGNSVFALRILPTICSGFIMWLTALITVDLGGKKIAITIACATLIFSPGFAASGYLFEPVVFDQLWWLLATWLLIRYIKNGHVKYLYWLGAVIGVGLLTKYTMGIFAVALILSVLISGKRQLFLNRHVAISAGIAFLILLPNLIWQFSHHFPFLSQMAALKKQQLDNLTPAGFILHQLVDNGMGVAVWLPGLLFLFIKPEFKAIRFIPLAYVLLFGFYLIVNGKDYYLFGLYPPLFAAGGVTIERWLTTTNNFVRAAIIGALVAPNILILPVALPVLTFKQTVQLIGNELQHLPFLRFVVIWDDGREHQVTQNYGDMLGWDELAARVAETWGKLTPAQQAHTLIYAGNYGEAAAISYYSKKYSLPRVVSLSSSFALWAPENIDTDYIIYIDENIGTKAENLAFSADTCEKTGSINNPLSIEHGTAVFLLVHPKPSLNELYRKNLNQKRSAKLFNNWENIAPGKGRSVGLI